MNRLKFLAAAVREIQWGPFLVALVVQLMLHLVMTPDSGWDTFHYGGDVLILAFVLLASNWNGGRRGYS